MFISRIKKYYKTRSIQFLISFLFTLVSIFGTISICVALLLRFDSELRDMDKENGERIISQVNFSLDNHLRRIMQVSDTIYYNLIKDTDFEDESIDEEIALLFEENRSSLVSISLFDNEGGLVSSYPYGTLKTGIDLTETEWYEKSLESTENLHFFVPRVQNIFDKNESTYHWVVSLARYAELTQKGSVNDGVLLVDMNFSEIEQICSSAEIGNDGYIYLASSEGEIIYHPMQHLLYSGIGSENNEIAVTYSDGTHYENFNGVNRQITVKTVGYTGWKLIGVVEQRNIILDTPNIFLFVIFVLLFFVFLLTFLNFRISKYIADPLKKLDETVRQLDVKGMEIEVDVDSGCNEVRNLAKTIRSMVSTMRHLMDDIISQEEEKRRIEYEVLQSQINPHFLYNSLDSVIWMTESGRYEEAIQMVTSLARLFRISLSKGNTLIPIEDEISHAKNYMIIQKIRYKNQFEVEFIIEDDIFDIFVLKLSLQPLLENAIYHGMTNADEGIIKVHFYKKDERLIIDVIDDGMGIPPDLCEKLLDRNHKNKATKGSGIGLKNVHHRIKLAFGEEYGLEVISELDEGTTMRMKLPILTEGDEKNEKH